MSWSTLGNLSLSAASIRSDSSFVILVGVFGITVILMHCYN
ncbi:hypothetical protein DDB_G0269792 [Dictyostelium discoideum AX4]|nr:hypothetical protein DDB_G0269792 [Dictyostelium discoideum AX4]EAL72246.1 hypothetical protein DDB_G0269792 [Dictyostelium discoideum AX4]|eukprot:XP_646283.1 hypothetical protein DDB_G0269792 [Dictyostelium discoideum AX4]